MTEPVPVHFDGVIYQKQKHGGISRVFDNLLDALSRISDIEMTLHIPSESRRGTWPDEVALTQIPDLRDWRPSRVFRRYNAWRRRKAIWRHWRRPNAGVFHSTYYSTYPALRIAQVLTIQDCIYEDHPQCFPNQNQWLRHMDERSRAVQAADLVVCPSEHSKQRTLHHYGEFLDPQQIHVIPYGIEPAFGRLADRACPQQFRTKYAGGNRFLLHVGSRHPHKNTDTLLRAYSAWSGRSDVHLLSVGGGSWTTQEQRQIDAMKLRDIVHNVNALDNAGLVAAYTAAEFVVVPSLDEGFGFPLLESMACGTPVIAARAGSLPEIGADVARYFDPLDADSLRQAFETSYRAWKDPAGQESLKAHAGQYTWERCAETHAIVYRKAFEHASRN